MSVMFEMGECGDEKWDKNSGIKRGMEPQGIPQWVCVPCDGAARARRARGLKCLRTLHLSILLAACEVEEWCYSLLDGEVRQKEKK